MKMEMHYIKGRYDIAMGDYDSGIANIEKSIFLAQKLNAHKIFWPAISSRYFMEFRGKIWKRLTICDPGAWLYKKGREG